VYFVILLNRTCFGKLDNDIAYFPKVTLSERVPAVILATLILFLGIQPNWLVRWGEPTATYLTGGGFTRHRETQFAGAPTARRRYLGCCSRKAIGACLKNCHRPSGTK
jgi:hypothetical protein